MPYFLNRLANYLKPKPNLEILVDLRKRTLRQAIEECGKLVDTLDETTQSGQIEGVLLVKDRLLDLL